MYDEMILWEDAKTFMGRTYPNCISEDEDDCFYCPECGEITYIDGAVKNTFYQPAFYKYVQDRHKENAVFDINFNRVHTRWNRTAEHTKEIDKKLNEPIISLFDLDEISIEPLYTCGKLCCDEKVTPDITVYEKSMWSRKNYTIALIEPKRAQKYRFSNLKKATLEDFKEQISESMKLLKRTGT